MNTRTRNRLLAAVVAALPVLALTVSAPAQTRVNQDGRAHDANTRVGSDGSNDSGNGIDRRGQTVTGNQIVTGNVSGNRAFTGPVPYRDPYEFSGPTAGTSSDRLIRDSAGAPTRDNPNPNYGEPTAFYGARRAVPPPPGFRPDGFTGGYFNTGASQTTSATQRNPLFQSTSEIFDSTNAMLRPGTTTLDAGLDDKNQPTMLAASPLYGVLRVDSSLTSQGFNPDGTARTAVGNRRTAADRAGLLPGDIERMRQELIDTGRQGDQDNAQDNATQTPDPNNLSKPVASQSVDGTVGTSRGESTDSARANAAVDRNQGTGVGVGNDAANKPSNPLDARVNAGVIDGRSLQTSQGLDRRINVPPAKQSKLYAELQSRLQQENGDQAANPEDSQRQLRLLRSAQNGAEPQQPGDKAAPADGKEAQPPLLAPITPRKGALGARPGAAKKTETPKTGAEAKPEAPVPAETSKAPAAKEASPLRIKSLAEGVQAKGLHDLLAGAEDLMRAGKFTSAIEKYAAAEQVAPNNPLIRLGRAQAEMGATRYGSAEQHLREALTADPALLMGQYDLEAFMGRERLSFIVQDLKHVAASEVTAARPMILLAYIAHGMPDQDAATADYLDQAAKRAGRPDALISAMRKHWKLPEASGGAAEQPAPKEQLNK